MKNILLLFLIICSIPSYGQIVGGGSRNTGRAAAAAAERASERANISVPFLTMQQVRSGEGGDADVLQVINNGRVWTYKYNPSSTAADDSAFVIRNGDKRYEIITDRWVAEIAGAAGDGLTDDTKAYQKLTDYLKSIFGGIIQPFAKPYLINQNWYINPSSEIPIAIVGESGFPSHVTDYINAGTRFVRTVPGDMIRVNLDANGNTVLPATKQYYGFRVENVGFSTQGGVVNGVNAIRMFRTRSIFRNVTANRIDYLVYQPNTDAGGNSNYCDKSEFSSVTIIQSRLGGLKLAYADATTIDRYHFENPNSTCKYGLEIFASSEINVRNLLLGLSLNHATVSGGAFVRIESSDGATFLNCHLESSKFESLFDIFYSNNFKASGIHTRFFHNNFAKITNSKIVTFEGLEGRATLQSGYNDLVIIGDEAGVKNVTFKNYTLKTYPDTKRSISVLNSAGLSSSIYGEDYLNLSAPIDAVSGSSSSWYFNQKLRATANGDILSGIKSNPIPSIGTYTGVLTNAFEAVSYPYLYRGASGNALEVRALDGTMKARLSAAGNLVLPSLFGSSANTQWDMTTDNTIYRIGGTQRVAIWDNGSVGIGSGATKQNSIAFEVFSTTQGVRLSPMTTTQRDAISSPVEGLEAFNTTTKEKNLYNGTAWVPLSTVQAISATASGNGSATTISIPHGQPTTPLAPFVQAANAAAAGISYVTVDATNVNVVYTVAPASGTNNLSYNILFKR